MSVRPAALWGGELGKGVRAGLGKMESPIIQGVREQTGLGPAELERVTLVLLDRQGPPVLCCRATKALDRKTFLARLVPDGKAEKYAGWDYLASETRAAVLLGEREYAVGGKADVQNLLDGKPDDGAPALAAAVALAAKGHSLVVGVNPTKLPQDEFAPDKLGPLAPLLRARQAALAVDLGVKSTGRLSVVFASPADATEGQKALEAARKQGLPALAAVTRGLRGEKGRHTAELQALLGQVHDALKVGKLARHDREVTATVELKVDPQKSGQAGLALVDQVRQAAMRAQSANNLKQLALALHNYNDTYRSMPPHAVYDPDGKPTLSWRVLLLPYLGQNALYREFRLNEPWDSAHNKKLLARMPAVFRAPSDRPPPAGHTFYQAFVGKGAAFEGKKGLRLPADFPDGTSNTMVLAEAARAVPWTKPDDLAYQPGKAPPELGGLFPPGFHAAFVDGSVRFFRKPLKEATLHCYITRNGGEVIPRDD